MIEFRGIGMFVLLSSAPASRPLDVILIVSDESLLAMSVWTCPRVVLAFSRMKSPVLSCRVGTLWCWVLLIRVWAAGLKLTWFSSWVRRLMVVDMLITLLLCCGVGALLIWLSLLMLCRALGSSLLRTLSVKCLVTWFVLLRLQVNTMPQMLGRF